MLKNYLTVAVRNILRHKVYSFINIMGLAVGMVCCILILLWVQDEMSYDRFHENEELAEKYFGDEDSLGKTITLNHKYDFEVTGVLEDIPQNSSIKPTY